MISHANRAARGTRPQLHDDAQLDWVRRLRGDVPLMNSGCTGFLVYVAAWLLSGCPATTSCGSLDKRAELDPTIDVRPQERFVDDGDVVTSAGISARIDMVLPLVDRLAGTERAPTCGAASSTKPRHPCERAHDLDWSAPSQWAMGCRRTATAVFRKLASIYFGYRTADACP